MERKRQALLHKLIEKKEKLLGYKILKELDLLYRMYYTVEKNFIDLMDYIKKCENELIFEIFENGSTADTVEMETLRLLHNYLSSIQSLIDHIKRTQNNINNIELNKYFEEEMNDFTKKNCVIFIKNFRNYIQHFCIPLLQQEFIISRAEGVTIEAVRARDADFKFNVFLNKKELLKWDKWNAQSKIYINKYIEKKELKTIILEYHNINNIHYEKFWDKINIIYKKDIDIVNKINNEIHQFI